MVDSNDKEQAKPEEKTTVPEPAAPSQNAGSDNGEKVKANAVELSSLAAAKNGAQPQDAELNLKMILDVPVDLRVELGSTNLSIGKIMKLANGSIIALDRAVGSPADIIVNGKLIGQGDVVVVDDNFGIRITKLVGPEERLESL